MKLLATLLVVLLAGFACSSDDSNSKADEATSSPTASATPSSTPMTSAPARTIVWSPDVVWPRLQIPFTLTMSDQELATAAQLAPEAVDFYEVNGFGLVVFRRFNNIDYGVATYGGNFGWGVFLNGQEPVLELPPPSLQSIGRSLLIEFNQAISASSHPDIEPRLWDPGFYFEASELTGLNDEELIFQFPISTCHACRTGYAVRAKYTFAPDGEFLGSKTLGLCREENSTITLPTQIDPCPANTFVIRTTATTPTVVPGGGGN